MNDQVVILFECTLGRVYCASVGSTVNDSYVVQSQNIAQLMSVSWQARVIRPRPTIMRALGPGARAIYINGVADVDRILRHLDVH